MVGFSLLQSLYAGVFSAGVHQGESGVVPDVIVRHVELLEAGVLVESLSQLQGALVPQPSVHEGQVLQGLVPWQGLQQPQSPRLQKSIITKSGGVRRD